MGGGGREGTLLALVSRYCGPGVSRMLKKQKCVICNKKKKEHKINANVDVVSTHLYTTRFIF
jgi:hypothetical protein